MRFLLLVLLGSGPIVCAAQPFTAWPVLSQTVQMANSGNRTVELVCPRKTPAPPRPGPSASEQTDIPDEDEVQEALQNVNAAHVPAHDRPPYLLNKSAGGRIAIWGDSHMAAAFFGEQLMRRLAPADAVVNSRFAHAGVGHAGVRGLVRKACLSDGWGRETAYAHADAAAAPGPGMTSLVAKRPGATLALDLRDAQGQPRPSGVQVLYHGDGADPTVLRVRVDDEAETEISLDKRAGPHALVLQTPQALSTLQIQVVSGHFRFQGLQWAPAANTSVWHLDVLAYPGATMAGWVRSDLAYLASWFTDQPYDLALIAFGTNEGNDPHFDEAAYREMLTQAVVQFRQVFPQTPCVLIGPGDRGIRVIKSKSAKNAKKQALKGKSSAHAKTKNKAKGKAASPAPTVPAVKLLKYARVHEQIGLIQAEVAAQQGCLAWSMQTAMGGVGSAYTWVRKNPPLMAPDLIHFTSAGYRELANRFLSDFGLTAP